MLTREGQPRPAVLLPGWFVEVHAQSAPEVWVLNPKMPQAYIDREPVGLKAEDVALVASGMISKRQAW